jgi:ethanolamine ammonia-lyase small subunit
MSAPDPRPSPAEALWARLADLTPARIGLGRTGASQPTREVLRFQQAHAAARDAIHVPLDLASLEAQVAGLGCRSISVRSDATERSVYLRRPDLGRRLSPESVGLLDGDEAKGCDIVIVIGDGLSSRAVAANAVPLLAHLVAYATHFRLSMAPVILAEGTRVALGDEIGQRLGARLCIMLIGERPGLSAPDSLGAYITYGPRIGASDADRNCVSNIRAGGLDAVAAAYRIAWLIRQAFALRFSGTRLKDESDREANPEVLRVGGS